MPDNRKSQLSASLEDYLEAILGLVQESGVARVRDIATKLGVNKSAVTNALKSLAVKNLVNYDPYQYITLTDEGWEAAEDIFLRHQVLRRFLAEVLELDPATAEQNACLVEHVIDKDVLRRLACFLRFTSDYPDVRKKWARYLAGSLRRQNQPSRHRGKTPRSAKETDVSQARKNGEMLTTLDKVNPGQKVTVRKVGGKAAANRRLSEMGLLRNTEITLIRVAPLGDPLEIKVRGYNLSLRKREARDIKVAIEA